MSENSHGRVADATGLLPSGSNPSVSSLSAGDPSRGPAPGDLNYRSGWEASREISHDEAREIARRLIASHFRRTDCETARVGIPARPDYDDDLLICSYIKQQSRKDASASRGWQPIATAPKGDEETILVCDARVAGGFHQVVWWDADSKQPEYRWDTSDGPKFHRDAFTHWMPLPRPPQGIEARSAETLGSAEGESPVAEGDAPAKSEQTDGVEA